jgi:peptidoglycan/LPS O-acetylase OafA/YrhL
VDLFFVLSGFLITEALLNSRKDPHYYRNFFARRLLRIFPLYYATLPLLFWVLPPALRWLGYSPAATDLAGTQHLSAWTYMLNWTVAFTGWASVSKFVSHFWSLGVEEQFYAVSPFFVRNLTERSLKYLALCALFVAPALRYAFHAMNMPVAAYTLPFSRMDDFAVGALLALFLREPIGAQMAIRWGRWIGPFAACGLVAVIATARNTRYGDLTMDTLGFTCLAVLFGSMVLTAVAASPGTLSFRLLSSGPLRFFGKYSYCLYIWHGPVILLLAAAGWNGAALAARTHNIIISALLVNLAAFAISISIALLSWALIEGPFLRLKRKFVMERRTMTVEEQIPRIAETSAAIRETNSSGGVLTT